MSNSSEDENKERSWIVAAATAIPVILLTHWIAPGHIPFSISDIWSFHDTGFVDWLTVGWPLFAWGFGVTVFLALILPKRQPTLEDAIRDFMSPRPKFSRGRAIVGGFIISVWAGLAEEIAFRWLIYLASFAYIAIINFLFFGFLGFGIADWFYHNLLGPLANWTTLGYLSPWLKGENWLVGAAMLSANAFFRDGHKYNGWIGVINSWFLGMAFFYIMLTHGLLAAIVVHFTYDLIVFTTAAMVRSES